MVRGPSKIMDKKVNILLYKTKFLARERAESSRDYRQKWFHEVMGEMIEMRKSLTKW